MTAPAAHRAIPAAARRDRHHQRGLGWQHRWTLTELELTNVLRSACLRKRMNAEAAQGIVAQIGLLPIEVDRQAVLRDAALASGVGLIEG